MSSIGSRAAPSVGCVGAGRLVVAHRVQRPEVRRLLGGAGRGGGSGGLGVGGGGAGSGLPPCHADLLNVRSSCALVVDQGDRGSTAANGRPALPLSLASVGRRAELFRIVRQVLGTECRVVEGPLPGRYSRMRSRCSVPVPDEGPVPATSCAPSESLWIPGAFSSVEMGVVRPEGSISRWRPGRAPSSRRPGSAAVRPCPNRSPRPSRSGSSPATRWPRCPSTVEAAR